MSRRKMAVSLAGLVPVGRIREYNVTHGVPRTQVYDVTTYIMGALFVIGFVANFRIEAINKRRHMMTDVEPEMLRARLRRLLQSPGKHRSCSS